MTKSKSELESEPESSPPVRMNSPIELDAFLPAPILDAIDQNADGHLEFTYEGMFFEARIADGVIHIEKATLNWTLVRSLVIDHLKKHGIHAIPMHIQPQTGVANSLLVTLGPSSFPSQFAPV